MNIILLGAPGSGKGTQAERMSAEYGLPIIGTGQILRDSIKREESLGLKAKGFIEQGLLVPDDIIMGIVGERLKHPDCKRGFITDGIPRTIAQAEALDKITTVGLVLDFDVDIDEVVKRIAGRLFCEVCGATYHITTNPPKKKGICDMDGAALKQRADDSEASVRKRMEQYNEKTAPLKEFYAKRGILKTINASQPIGKVYQDIQKVLLQQ